MKKKGIIILCTVVGICAIGVISSFFIDWPVDFHDAGGDIAKASRFSREQVTDKLTNMEELLQTDSTQRWYCGSSGGDADTRRPVRHAG